MLDLSTLLSYLFQHAISASGHSYGEMETRRGFPDSAQRFARAPTPYHAKPTNENRSSDNLLCSRQKDLRYLHAVFRQVRKRCKEPNSSFPLYQQVRHKTSKPCDSESLAQTFHDIVERRRYRGYPGARIRKLIGRILDVKGNRIVWWIEWEQIKWPRFSVVTDSFLRNHPPYRELMLDFMERAASQRISLISTNNPCYHLDGSGIGATSCHSEISVVGAKTSQSPRNIDDLSDMVADSAPSDEDESSESETESLVPRTMEKISKFSPCWSIYRNPLDCFPTDDGCTSNCDWNLNNSSKSSLEEPCYTTNFLPELPAWDVFSCMQNSDTFEDFCRDFPDQATDLIFSTDDLFSPVLV